LETADQRAIIIQSFNCNRQVAPGNWRLAFERLAASFEQLGQGRSLFLLSLVFKTVPPNRAPKRRRRDTDRGRVDTVDKMDPMLPVCPTLQHPLPPGRSQSAKSCL